MSKTVIPFRGFDEQGPARIYASGILPHLRQNGCTYFVTFRLKDSIPLRVLQEIEYERAAWLKARGIDPLAVEWKGHLAKLTPNDRRLYEQLVGRLVNKSLDECLGACVLRAPSVSAEVASALRYFDGTRVLTGDFVVMPNHAHALLTPTDGFELEDILHSIKSFTSNRINRILSRTGALWQRESYDHVVRDAEQLVAYQHYIAGNPEKAKLRTGEYVLSTAQYCCTP